MDMSLTTLTARFCEMINMLVEWKIHRAADQHLVYLTKY